MKKKLPDAKVQLPILYQQMADLTRPECQNCRASYSCCSPEYCEYAAVYAKEKWGTTLVPTGHKRIPFMGGKGCIVPPHMRPMCTMHTCDINSLGFHRTNLDWTKKYFRLRQRIEQLEFQLDIQDQKV